ncbi:MAG: serine/threonine protein kinase [Planctomycetes bacterium]|nr:serine/threonine protein kinase [Planctomycetota bacterium]
MPELAGASVTPQTRSDHDYPMVGETIGLWRLVRGLGRGGMGEVYEAEYDYLHLVSLRYSEEQRDLIKGELEALSRPEQARLVGQMIGTPLPADARFAIKICNARSGTPGYRRFLQEAEVAQRLGDHPYIVTVHQVSGGLDASSEIAKKLALDKGKYRDLAFMVMDLANCTFDNTRLTIGETVHIVRCIATSLDHAHSQGVVHRDLKPENILGTVDHPLLTDFGIAKEIDQTEGLTRTGQIIGTLDYMSPEQATDAKRVDQRSDVYSLGVVLYEFATQGHLPYSHKLDRDSCLTAIRSDRVEPKWPREHQARFPVRLERIILKAMAHRPEDRYQTMSEFITDLDRFTRGEALGWWGRVRPNSLLRFQVRRHPRMVYGSIVAAVLAVIVVASLTVPKLLDSQRREYAKKLAQIEEQVSEVASRKLMQLDKERSDALRVLKTNLSDERYPEFRRRLGEIEDRLLRYRRLDVRFTSGAKAGDNALPPTAAKEALQLAARSEKPNWFLDPIGLHIDESYKITLGPYGKGVVFWYAVLQLPTSEGFQVQAQEEDADNGSRHTVRWSILDGLLVCQLIEDEKPPLLLRQEPAQGQRVRVAIAMELGPAAIRTWVNGKEQRANVRGLRDRSPAMITMDLPKDSYLEKLVVEPTGPK